MIPLAMEPSRRQTKVSKVGTGLRRIPAWGWVIALLLLLTVLAFQAGDLEWEELETDLGYTEEARRNPYLAAKMFLQQWGADVTTSSGLRILDNMPNVSDTIVITSSRFSLSQRRSDQLSQWLNEGGHLVVMVSAVYDADTGDSGDKLLDGLGIYLADPVEEESEYSDEGDNMSPDAYEEEAFRENYYDLQEYQSEFEQEHHRPEAEAYNTYDGEIDPEQRPKFSVDSDAENTDITEEISIDNGDEIVSRTLKEILSELGETTDYCNDLADLTQVSVADEEEDLAAHLWGNKVIYYTEENELAWAANNKGTQLIQISVGEGRLTALTDTGIWNNRRVICHDHAYLLWVLVRDGGKVWISFNESMPGVFDLLKKHAPWVLAWFIGLLVVWIWARTLQFGPLHASETNMRRDFMDHLSASARYLQRAEQGSGVLELLRTQILAHLKQRFPGFETLSLADQQGLIVETISADSEKTIDLISVKTALYAEPPQQESAFIEMVKTLQRLKQLLKVNDF